MKPNKLEAVNGVGSVDGHHTVYTVYRHDMSGRARQSFGVYEREGRGTTRPDGSSRGHAS